MKRIVQKRAGFTLIEMLLYMGILSILLLVLTNIFNSTLDVQLESQGTSSVIQDGHYIISRLTYDMNRAKKILVPASPGNSSPTLNITVGSTNYVYSLSGQDIILTNNLGANKLNSFDTNISNLNFKYLQAANAATTSSTISISFTLTSKAARANGPEVKTLQTTLGLRKN
jgi:prepilin-type N-terminal cleavage/methylation domain-containing protein